jgi:hypothetical protein
MHLPSTESQLLIHFPLISLDLYKKKPLPTLELLESLRGNEAIFTIFLDQFVAAVLGKDVLRHWCYVQEPSKYVTSSDEAMTMLIVANNYEV